MNKDDYSLSSQTDWARLHAQEDQDIDLSDAPELTEAELQALQPTRAFFAERGIAYAPRPPHTVTVYQDDSVTTHMLAPASNVVILDADVLAYFPDSASVNRALRGLIELIPDSN